MKANFADLIAPAGCRPTAGKMPFNIFLTGFMGAGKTSIGKQLALELDIDCYDTDEIIAAAARMSIRKLFLTKGEPFFRQMESELLKLLGEKPPGSCIVSTGGGAVLREENRSAMRKNGVIILLKVTAEEIGRRINGDKNRPLLMTADLMKSVEELLEKRRPFYSKADLVIETSELTISETVSKVIKAAWGWN